jgi:hypothetical protein
MSEYPFLGRQSRKRASMRSSVNVIAICNCWVVHSLIKRSWCYGFEHVPLVKNTSVFNRSKMFTGTNPNDFNGLPQTTNLGVRSSNLFGRAISRSLFDTCTI